jgi:glutamate 5-kinase
VSVKIYVCHKKPYNAAESKEIYHVPMSETILIKLGTNVLTKPDGALDLAQIKSLSEQIYELKKKKNRVVLVSSGAVGAGLQINKFNSVKDKLIRRQMLASVGQSKLIGLYSKYLEKHNINVAQALLTSADFSNKESSSNMKEVLLKLLDAGIVPIINENDVISTEELTFGDNDILGAYTAILIKADRYIILTTVDGLCDKDPSSKDAKLITKVEKINGQTMQLCGSTKSSLGAGGMQSKLKAAKMATDAGIETVMANGKTEKVQNIIKGKFTGTTFKTKKK